MNEEEKKAVEILKGLCTDDCINNDVVQAILNLIEKQQKEIKARLKEIDSLYKMMSAKDDEIEDLKAITRTYEAYKLGEGNKIMIASKEWFNGGYFEENYISKDKLKEIIEEHKKFLSEESSKYDEDDIENRKAIQYASVRLSFLLADIYKLGE